DHPILPLPLWHDHPEKGGFYAAGEYLYWRMTNPLKQQVVAERGLDDVGGSPHHARQELRPLVVAPANRLAPLTPPPKPHTGGPVLNPDGTVKLFPVPAPPAVNGAFFGSGATALDVHQLTGPNTYQPGFGVTLGWKFCDGFTLEFSWKHLTES